MTTPENPQSAKENTEPTIFDLDPGYEDALLEALYILEALDKVEDFYIDEVSRYNEGNDQQKIITLKINELCKVLGIQPTRWTEHVVSCDRVVESYREENVLSDADKKVLAVRGTSIGEYLFDRSFAVLPIEWGDEGSGSISITLRTPDDYEITILTEGIFDTSYAEGSDVDDTIDPDGQMEIKINYTASIKKRSDE